MVALRMDNRMAVRGCRQVQRHARRDHHLKVHPRMGPAVLPSHPRLSVRCDRSQRECCHSQTVRPKVMVVDLHDPHRRARCMS